jgi:hypothetical protein
MSLIALAAAVLTAVVLRIEQGRPGRSRKRSGGAEISRGHLFALVILGLGLLALKGFIVDRTATFFRRPSGPELAHSLLLQGNELQLLGYNLSQTQVASGATLDVDMAWTAVAPPPVDYQTNVWLVDDQGVVWSDKETHRPRLYEDAPRTRFWQPGQWAWDSREVATLSGTPPGEYDLALTLFERATLQPVTLVDSTGAVIGPTAILGQITITPPQTAVEFKPQYSLAAAVGSAQLLGYNQDRQEAAPGEPLLLTFFWQQSAGQNMSLALQQENRIVHEWPLELPDGPYRSQHLLRLPATLASGAYTFVLNKAVSLGQLQLNAPERIFEQPEIATAVNIPFTEAIGAPQATLIGYTLAPRPSPLASLSISLLWQANADMTTSYRVFIHLVDGSGQIIGQTDGEPANWTRPTTGWVVGEYILDEHQLNIQSETSAETFSAETLSLRVGLYNAETGERLQTEAADFVTILLTEP